MSHLIRSAWEPPRWALQFYVRHALWILPLMGIPAAERLFGQLGERDPFWAILAEALTMAVRVVFVIGAVYAGVLRDPVVGRLSRRVASERLDRYLKRNVKPLLLQGAGMCAVFLVMNAIPEYLVPALIDAGPWYWAVLLAVKNLTVIPLTLLWWVGLARDALRIPEDVDQARSPRA